MRRASRLAAAMVLVLALASPGGAQTSEEIKQAADNAIRDLDLQRDLPREPRISLPSWNLKLPSEVVWGGLILGAVLILYSLGDVLPDLIPGWRSSRRFQRGDAADRPAGSGAEPPDQAMTAADELARQGRFGEAMHALLLQSLADIRRRLDTQFADSLTSREILRNVALPEHGRTSLHEIVASVERTYFGDYPAESADYDFCRERFNELSRALHGGASA